MRSAALVLALAGVASLAGCFQVFEVAALAALPFAPLIAAAPTNPDPQAEIRLVKSSSDDAEGGYGGEVHATELGGKPLGVAGATHVALGAFGKDRVAGVIDGEIGASGGAPGFHIGVLTGFAYGGFLRNARSFPLRIITTIDARAFSLRGSVYAGWRVREDGTPQVRKLGPWTTWGGSLDATVLKIGPSFGLSWDRQDDITVFGFHVGVGAHARM